MVPPQEDILVNIEVDTKPAKRGVEDLNEALAENTKQTKAIQKELQRLEKEYKSIATAAKKLPSEQASQLAKEVSKAERATSRLSDQFDRTSSKLDKVHDRTVGAAQGFAALTAAVTAVANLDTLIKFTDRVNKAAQAVLQFSENVGPVIKTTQDLFRKGFEQGSFIVANFSNIIKAAGAAITEHRQILEGYQHVAVGIPRVHQAINDSFRGLASAAKFLERGLVSIRDFAKQTQEGLGRVRTLFKTIVEGSATVMDVLGQLGSVFGSTFGASTGGAARLNAFQIAYLSFQDLLERGGAKLAGIFKSIGGAVAAFVARGTSALVPFLKDFGLRIIEVARGAEALAAKGFATLLKGMIDVGVKGLRLGQDMGFLGKGFIGLIDNSAMMGGALLGLGTLLKRTDSVVLDVIGSFIQLVGVLSVSLSAGLTIVTGLIGQFFLAVGSKLFAISDAWEEKFTKMQQVTQAFEFTIQGFSKTLGEAATGGLAFWTEQINVLTQTTAFGVAEVQKSIKVLIAEGSQLGITAEQNAALLKRAADVAANTGRDLSDVVFALAKGLGGQSESLKQMGIFVDNASLQHSKLAKSQGLVVEQMGSHAKAQLIVNSIMEQTIPLVGAAADQLNTIAGSQKQLSQTTDLLQAKLGSQSVVWAKVTQVQTAALATLTRLPDAFFDVIGGAVDVIAVLAKLAGAFLTTILTIAGIKGAIEALNLVLGQSMIAMFAVNTVINVLRESIGLKSVAIDSLKTALIALSQTVIPGITVALKGFQATLIATSKRVYAFVASLFFTQAGWASIVAGASAATLAVLRFTAALLANPWTYVIGGIVATVVAVRQLSDELEQFKTQADGVNQSITKTPSFMEQLASAAGKLGQVFVDIAKVVVIGWLKIVRVLELAAIGYQKLWAKITGNSKAMDDLEIAQGAVLDKLGELDVALDRTFGGGTAMAATMGMEVGRLTGKVQELTTAAQQRFDFGLAGAQVGALGTEFEKANLAIADAQFKLSELEKEAKKVVGTFNAEAGERFLPTPDALNKLVAQLKAARQETKQLEEITDKVSDAFLKKKQAEYAALALRSKIVEDANKASVEAEKARLEASNQAIAKIKLEAQEKLKQLEKDKEGLKNLAAGIPLHREQLAALEKQRKAILSVRDAQIAAVNAAADKKAQEERDKAAADAEQRLKDLLQMQQALQNINKETFQGRGDLIAAAQIERDLQLEKLDTQMKEAANFKELTDEAGNLKKEYADIFDRARDLAEQKFEKFIDSQSISSQIQDAIDAVDPRNFAGSVAQQLLTALNTTVKIGASIVEGVHTAFKGVDFSAGFGAAFDQISKNLGIEGLVTSLQGLDFSSLASFTGSFDKVLEEGGKIFDTVDWKKIGVQVGSFLSEKFIQGAALIGDLFDPEQINKIADFFGEFLQKLPDSLGKAFQKLDQVLAKFAESFPGLVKKILDALPGMIQSILNKLPAIIDALVKGLSMFLERLPGIISMILDALPGILEQLVKALPELVLKLFDAIGKIIAKVIQVLPELIKVLIDGLPDFVRAWMEGLIASMGDIVAAFVDFLIGGGLEKIVGALLRMIPKLVVAFVQGVVRGLVRAFSSIFNGIKPPPALAEIPGKFSEGLKKLTAKTTEEASKLFKVMDLEAQAKGLEAAKQVEDMANRVIDSFEFAFKGLFAWLQQIWQWVVDRLTVLWNILKTIWDTVIMVLQALWEFLKAIWDVVLVALQALWDALKTIWDVVLVALQALWTALKTIWDGVITALGESWKTLKAIWDGLKKIVDEAFKGVVDLFGKLKDIFTEAFKGISDFFSNVFKGKIDEAFKGVLDTFKGIGTKIWDDLKAGLGNLGSTIKDQLDAINPANLFSKIFQMDYKGTGTVEDTLGIDIPYANFAKGGMVPGSAMVNGDSLLNDRILALLSPGEAVVPRSIMQDPELGGIVRSVLSGVQAVQRFGFGGVSVSSGGVTIGGEGGVTIGGGGGISIGGTSAGDLLGGLDPRKLWDRAKEEAFKVVMRAFEANAFHAGGLVPAFAGGGEVPAMLQSGEFVINRTAAQSLGLGNLAALNQGGSVGDTEVNFEVNIDISSDGLPDESFVRQRLIPTVKKELKEASLRGEFLFSEKGIRKT